MFFDTFAQEQLSTSEKDHCDSGRDDEPEQENSWTGYFKRACAKDLAELKTIRTLHRFREGQTVVLNDPGNEGFYYIHSGYVKIVCKRWERLEVIRIAGASDLVGFARWFSPVGLYGMVALSEVNASYFRKDEFLKLQERSAYIANEVIRWLMDVLTYQEQRIFSLSGRAAKERVASILSSLYRRFGESIGCSNSIMSAPIDRKTLADLSGVAIEVLSRALSELESEKIINRQGRIIVIVDAKGLEKAAGF